MPAPVFVLGAPRSGTTLLRVMIAGNPRLFSPPEMILAPFATMAERRATLTERYWEKGGLRRALMDLLGVDVDAAKAAEAALEDRTVPEVYAWLQERLGERVLVDKCPHLAASPDALARVARWFPDARYVWIVRHPGSVVRSVQNMPMAEVLLQGYAPDARGIWFHVNEHIRRFLQGVPADHQVRVRYEELVVDARPAMEAICALAGVPFDARMLDPYEGDRMRDGPPGARAVGDPNMAGRGRVQPELATAWLDGFDPASLGPETHTLARELGYDLAALPPPPMAQLGVAMGALLDTVRQLERAVDLPADLDGAEGRRFLLRMLSASLDLFVEEGDADHPHFHHAEGPTRKMFADCPDADYLRAPVRLGDGRVYVVRGRVPAGTTYVGMLLYGKGGRVGRHLRDADFVRPDGTFEVRVAAKPQPGAWLQGDADTIAVFVRQYFEDRATQPPITLSVTLDPPAGPPAPLRPETLTRAVQRAQRNLEVVHARTLEVWKMARVAALNRFVAIPGDQLFPTPDNAYLACWFRIGADQCLVVRGRVGACRYWSLTVYNLWMESLDYRHHAVCLNRRHLRLEPDGGFVVALSHTDLGAPNRLDPAGHLSGYLLVRALLPEGDVPVPSVEVRYAREGLGA